MTTFGTQANAIFRKNAVYQKRAVCTNICLLLAPILFCAGLSGLQVAINSIFSGEDFKCGCKCVQCCYGKDCTIKDQVCSTDGYKCLLRDKTTCGPLYSNLDQIAWCPIKTPSFYPPAQQVPNNATRAVPARPDATILYTAANPDPSIKSLMDDLIPPQDPVMLKENLGDALTALYAIPDLSTPEGIEKVLYFDGRPLSRAGLVFGTERDPELALYRDGVFSTADAVMSLSKPGTCSRLAPLVNGTRTLPQEDFFLHLTATACSIPLSSLNATSNSSSLALLANLTKCLNLSGEELQSIFAARQAAANASASGVGRGAAAGLKTFPGMVECVDVQTVFKSSVAELNRALYCGYADAKCAAKKESNDYAAAVDLTGMDLKSTFKITLYNNKTVANTNSGPPVKYLRFQTTLDLLVNSWLRRVLGPGAKTAKLVGVQSMPKLASSLNLDFSSILGPLFYSWVVQLLLPTFLVQLVYEKEKKLRMMMKMHGLGDMAYWLVMYSWYLSIYLLYIIILLIAGSAAQLRLFTLNNYGIQIIHYILFGNCMIAFAFLLSCFFTSSRTAVVAGLLYVFGTGLISELLLKRFMDVDANWLFFVEWVPSFGLYRGLWEFSEYAFLGNYQNSPGLTFAKLDDPKNGIKAVWGIFVVEWFVFMGLAWYLEQVLSSGSGVRRHPLFFLPGFGKAKVQAGAASSHVVNMASEREDVEAERQRVEQLSSFNDNLIVVKDLRKVYPGQDGTPPKVAVQSLTLGIERGECFGLLGPNGAGKSTSINMMTGFLEPSGGQAILAGYDLRTQVDKIYGIMGVCPQHDLLWETLTAREHLLFYGRLKGLKGKVLQDAVTAALQSVNLFNRKVGDKMVRKYSGGMKRRLSVAISFIGSPSIVYLDEPSTGLDPASRRNLWDVVKGSKRDRAIILTTHSMEEAEVLCDRLGIFVDGRLVCVGNPKEITARYGGYYVFTLMVEPGSESTAMEFVRQMSPSSILTYHVGGTLKYEVPSSEVTLSGVFNGMQQLKQRANILDWGISNATLEEVFIKFARSIGANTVKD